MSDFETILEKFTGVWVGGGTCGIDLDRTRFLEYMKDKTVVKTAELDFLIEYCEQGIRDLWSINGERRRDALKELAKIKNKYEVKK